VHGALDIGVLHAGETNYTQLPGDTLEKKVVLLRRQRSRRRHDQRQLAISEPDRAPSSARLRGLAGAARRPTRSRLS
jgi:hypothetical protein